MRSISIVNSLSHGFLSLFHFIFQDFANASQKYLFCRFVHVLDWCFDTRHAPHPFGTRKPDQRPYILLIANESQRTATFWTLHLQSNVVSHDDSSLLFVEESHVKMEIHCCPNLVYTIDYCVILYKNLHFLPFLFPFKNKKSRELTFCLAIHSSIYPPLTNYYALNV